MESRGSRETVHLQEDRRAFEVIYTPRDLTLDLLTSCK